MSKKRVILQILFAILITSLTFGLTQEQAAHGISDGSPGNPGPTTQDGPGSGTPSGNPRTEQSSQEKKEVSNKQVYDAVKNGESLSSMSTEQLQMAYDSLGNSESDGQTKDTIKNELDRRKLTGEGDGEGDSQGGLSESEKKEIAEAEQAAKDAEDAAAEAVKEYTEAKDKAKKAKSEKEEKDKAYNDAVQDMLIELGLEQKKVSEEKKASLEEMIKNAAEAKEQAQDAYEAAQKAERDAYEKVVDAANDMKAAYENLAGVYQKYGVTGDPVRIDNGEYIASYEDFAAQDFITNFTITRDHIAEKYDSSFGENWTCSLDARIIRGEPATVSEEYLQALATMINACDKIVEICEDYEQKYPKYPSVNLAVDKILAVRAKLPLPDWYELKVQRRQEALIIHERNKYVTYGKYADFNNYETVADVLFFVDSDGQEYIFGKYGNEWKTYGTYKSKKLSISSYTSNEIRIQYTDGRYKIFNKYGILQEEADRNGNKTKYYNENGKINRVVLATGENLTISRNSGGHITEISGPVSGSSKYEYSGNRLTAVTDNSGIKITYSYDSEGNITSIGKPDGTSVTMKYEKDSYTGKTVCKSVTNENGQTETFDYNYQNGKVTHKNIYGNTEYYELTKDGFVTKFTDEKGNVVQITPDSKGLVQSIIKNKQKVDYTYDEYFRPTKESFARGGEQKMEYNGFGQLKSLKDRDGVEQSYTYDSKGNITAVYYCGTLISSATYNGKGLVESLTENGVTYRYSYNAYGSLVKRTWTDSYGKTYSEIWKYDDKNRVTQFTSADGEVTDISYSSTQPDATVTEVQGNSLKTVTKYDSRNRVSELSQEDLKTGRYFTLKYIYDGCGNVIHVLLDGNLYTQYNYNARGNLTDYTVIVDGKQAKTTYTYNSDGYITGETVAVENEAAVTKYTCNYSKNGQQTIVNVNCGGQVVQTYYYNEDGKLIKTLSQDGFTKNISYSQAGRISSVTDSNGHTYTYKYNTDGTYQITVKDSGGYSSIYKYNQNKNLVSVKDQYNQIETYVYDSYGNMIKQTYPGGITEYTYDLKGRVTSKTIKSNAGKIEYTERKEYDDKNRTVTNYTGNQFVVRKTYDAWNHVVRVEEPTETYTYDYDWFGNCIRKTDSKGNSIEYKYSPANKMMEKKDADGVVTKFQRLSTGKLTSIQKNGIQTYAATYDSSGRTKQVINQFGSKMNFVYNAQTGYVSSIGRYDTGNINFETEITGKKITLVDANKNTIVYEIGAEGQIEKETDQLGNTTTYEYDKKGRLLRKEYYNGNYLEYVYDDVANTITKTSSVLDYVVYTYNSAGNVTKIENKNTTLTYDYDTAGRLIKSEDSKNKIPIEYFYDAAGNCSRKKSEYFDYHYEYDTKGNVTKVSDSISKVWVEIERNVRGQITLEKYSNGVSKSTSYNQLGEKTSVIIKNRFGAVINSQKVTYDDHNRIGLVENESGQFWKYDYDDTGKLIKVTSPYTQEQLDYAMEEATECGLGIKNEKPDGITLKLENGRVQYSWWEEYTYTPTGAVKTTKNPFGTINYEYDAKNRIISKNGANTESGGMQFTWSYYDCLVKITTPTKEMMFGYYINGEMFIKRVSYYDDKKTQSTYYFLDGLGRCIEDPALEYTLNYVYDGFSSNPVITSARNVDSLQIKKNPERTGTGKEYKFRWIDDDKKYIAVEEVKGIDESVRTVRSTFDQTILNWNEDSRPYVTMWIDGKSAVNLRVDGNYETMREPQFMVTDFFERKTGILNEKGDYTITDSYDVWGANLKQYEFIYKKGLRDYIPSIKSFAQQDRARDGSNWFSYCPCDPVNYSDEGGTIKRKKSNTPAEDALYEAAISEFLKYDKDEARKKGESQKIPIEYDCADVSSQIDKIARNSAGLGDSNSEKQNNFDTSENPRNEVCAADYWKDDWENSFRKVGDDFNDMDETNIGPGTVIVLKTSKGAKRSENHTITILAVDYDENGNIIGIAFIEGHIGDTKVADVDYAFFDPDKKGYGEDGVWNLGDWAGDFEGFFEIERNDTQQKCGK